MDDLEMDKILDAMDRRREQLEEEQYRQNAADMHWMIIDGVPVNAWKDTDLQD